MKKTYKIDVDCANCANKMEDAAKRTDGVKDATVNFMMLKMHVEFEDGRNPRLLCPLPAFCLPDSRDCQGKLHICQYCLMRNQVITLEYKSNRMIPVRIPIPVFIFFRGDPVDDKISAIIAVKASYYVKKRRLPRAAGPQDRNKFVVS